MKKLLFVFALTSILVLSCSKDNESVEDELKGLVSFSITPSFTNGDIVFAAQIQFESVGEAVNIDYKILDGNEVLFEETLATRNADGGVGLFFQTDELAIPLAPISYFSGKELLVWLDPDNKVTSSEYIDITNANLYKKETISIP